MSKQITVAYIPALHSGYVTFLKNNPHELFLIGGDLLDGLKKEKPYYGRDIRALDVEVVKKMIESLGIVSNVSVLDSESAKTLSDQKVSIIMPDEDISRDVAEKYFSDNTVEFINTFLRWDRKISDEEFIVPKGRAVSTKKEDRDIIEELERIAQKSSDWWRQIAAAIVKDGTMAEVAYNKHFPDDQNPNILGDPRSNYDYKEKPTGYTSIHAEANVIAKAAKKGESVEGAALYVTTFPCDACARLICESGIKKVFYKKGFSRLDSEDILKNKGIEIVLVEGN